MLLGNDGVQKNTKEYDKVHIALCYASDTADNFDEADNGYATPDPNPLFYYRDLVRGYFAPETAENLIATHGGGEFWVNRADAIRALVNQVGAKSDE